MSKTTFGCGCVSFIGEVVPCASHRHWVRPAPTLTVEATDPKARAEVGQLRVMVDGLAERVSVLAKKEREAQTILDGGRVRSEPSVFRECATCAAKPGTPILCAHCYERRALRGRIERALRTLDEIAAAAERGFFYPDAVGDIRKALEGTN